MSGTVGEQIFVQDLDGTEQDVVDSLYKWLVANPNAQWKPSPRHKSLEQCSEEELRKELRNITSPLAPKILDGRWRSRETSFPYIQVKVVVFKMTNTIIPSSMGRRHVEGVVGVVLPILDLICPLTSMPNQTSQEIAGAERQIRCASLNIVGPDCFEIVRIQIHAEPTRIVDGGPERIEIVRVDIHSDASLNIVEPWRFVGNYAILSTSFSTLSLGQSESRQSELRSMLSMLSSLLIQSASSLSELRPLSVLISVCSSVLSTNELGSAGNA
ncbi:Uncharacterized protein TPAR_06643 [Tolypocladium paradoxum]|uniref:Uncharacterized protein n=1 Tax=Tolypocladium paradoxum TaxID=94208 RepID=A0A2S4KSK4_9HYPO|nr:Uncharacterized protein TPAR_06643 [Tolypocladium paradoxum]